MNYYINASLALLRFLSFDYSLQVLCIFGSSVFHLPLETIPCREWAIVFGVQVRQVG